MKDTRPAVEGRDFSADLRRLFQGFYESTWQSFAKDWETFAKAWQNFATYIS